MGRIFDVARACVDDGPGLRTVVFLAGCHLDCPWCHNFEGKSAAPRVARDARRCLRCGRCQAVCGRGWPLDPADAWRDGCRACGRCTEVCPSRARRRVGREVPAATLVEELLGDRDFFAGTGGGVTFSGGEPLVQADFLFDCAARLHVAGVPVAVETAGFFPARHLAALAAVELVLFDLKHVAAARLATIGAGDGRVILDNLAGLCARAAPLEVRITLVPGFNDGAEDLEAMARWLLERSPRPPPVRLLAFQRLAAGKEALHAFRYPYRDVPPVPPRTVERAAARLSNLGLDAEPA